MPEILPTEHEKREITFAQAILEATTQAMDRDGKVIIMGLGVPDPKGIFGTTLGLKERFGSERVMDMPAAENGMTGVAIGAALNGLRPIMTHQRVDFALLALEQIVNQAAKWHYMFDGQCRVPLVIRMVIGRGWGQGPQHSQSLQSFFAHIPGLKVVMPFSPHDAKGLLAAAIEDDNPVIFLEHRWLHNIKGPVPQEHFTETIGKARIVRPGKDVTVVSVSHMTYEGLRAALVLENAGIDAEVVDVRSLRPLDSRLVLDSVRKTGRLAVLDTGWKICGFAGEVVAMVAEEAFSDLVAPPIRITPPDYPQPTSPALTESYFPSVRQICNKIMVMMEKDPTELIFPEKNENVPHDVPDLGFKGPF